MTAFIVLLGLVLCVFAGAACWERVKVDPHCEFAPIFLAICGFGVFPVINIAVALYAFWRLGATKP